MRYRRKSCRYAGAIAKVPDKAVVAKRFSGRSGRKILKQVRERFALPHFGNIHSQSCHVITRMNGQVRSICDVAGSTVDGYQPDSITADHRISMRHLKGGSGFLGAAIAEIPPVTAGVANGIAEIN